MHSSVFFFFVFSLRLIKCVLCSHHPRIRKRLFLVLIFLYLAFGAMNFLMVIMDSGIARGRVRTTTTTTATESRKMAALLQN